MLAENHGQLTCPTCPPDSFIRIPKDSEIIASKKSKIACRMQSFHLFPACNLTVLVREAGRQVLWQACVVSQTINLGWTNKHWLYQNLNAVLESLWESLEMLVQFHRTQLVLCTVHAKVLFHEDHCVGRRAVVDKLKPHFNGVSWSLNRWHR